MKKKLLAILLACAALLPLAGCSGNGDGQTLRVDAFFYDYADTYITTVRTELKNCLDRAGDGFSYGFYDGASSQATQTQQVETALIRGSQLLVVNIVTTGSDEAAQVILQNADARGVPVIFFNREVSDAIVRSSENCCFVGTDANEAGYKQGEMVADFFADADTVARYDRNGDGKLSYVMFRGELGNAEAFGRTKYSVLRANELLGGLLVPSAANAYDSTQENDGISPYYLYGNWSADLAKDLMDTALITYSLDAGDIELVLANNDEQALGAVESLQEHGYNTGDPARTIPVFGVDATDAARSAIDAGTMTGTVRQDGAAMAACIAALAENVRAGRPLLDGTDEYEKDEGVAKIRIPYGVYTAADGGDTASGTESPASGTEDSSSGAESPASGTESGTDGGTNADGARSVPANGFGDALPVTGTHSVPGADIFAWRSLSSDASPLSARTQDALRRAVGSAGPAFFRLPDAFSAKTAREVVRPPVLPLPGTSPGMPEELPNALLPGMAQDGWDAPEPDELCGICGAAPQERSGS